MGMYFHSVYSACCGTPRSGAERHDKLLQPFDGNRLMWLDGRLSVNTRRGLDNRNSGKRFEAGVAELRK